MPTWREVSGVFKDTFHFYVRQPSFIDVKKLARLFCIKHTPLGFTVLLLFVIIPPPIWELKQHRMIDDALGMDTTRWDEMIRKKEGRRWQSSMVEKQPKVIGEMDVGERWRQENKWELCFAGRTFRTLEVDLPRGDEQRMNLAGGH
jgi:hypothetical protein